MKNNTQSHTHTNPYDDMWYQNQVSNAYRSAKIYVEHLQKIIQPKRVVDVGCGRGAWLKAFGESSATTLVGIDGTWNSQEKMVDPKVLFYGVDLNRPISIDQERFDLGICLEVAEHLKPESAETFIRSLTGLSNVLVFGAAYSGQGGTDHFNEQPHSYWAEIFNALGYLAYDYFRPALWGELEVRFWYQQNTFLYVRQGSSEELKLSKLGLQPIPNAKWMNCIHPVMYEHTRHLSEMSVAKRYMFIPIQSHIPKRLFRIARHIKHLFIKPTQRVHQGRGT
jgi:SAM-dependent methyltransferase